ncbi:DUF7287 family protein [Natrononativus amylolyticus]|uniref:DUF7287 family protein n=1 Tax=Natrononativus amylolyticus TaxID=2963434 RepID=UPI0020CF675B|nr:hypothetical protein [Natrononativus amylolyticus]
MAGSSRPRRVSLSLAERGQTTQDFVVGIGVFLLAMAFVFSFVPSLLTPFDSSIGSAEQAQADRIAGEILSQYEHGDPNNLDFGNEDEFEDVDLTEMGLRVNNQGDPIDNVHVTIEPLGSGDEWETDDSYEDGQTAASASRIVTVEEKVCDPACRLIVRVW